MVNKKKTSQPTLGPERRGNCREHYNVREEYDEGFYDCCRGTCPQGHIRIVDD